MENIIDDRKRELLLRISEIFEKFGLRSTSMDEIAMHLKMSKKTLYQMFENKTDIVEQVSILRQHRFFNVTAAKDWMLKQDNLLEQLYIGMQHMSRSFNIIKSSNHYDVRKYYPEVYEKYVRHFDDQMSDFFIAFTNQCIQKGIFRDFPDYPLRNFLLMRLFSTLSNPEYQTETDYSPQEMILGMFDVYIRSIVTEKGMKQWEHILKNPPQIDVCDNSEQNNK